MYTILNKRGVPSQWFISHCPKNPQTLRHQKESCRFSQRFLKSILCADPEGALRMSNFLNLNFLNSHGEMTTMKIGLRPIWQSKLNLRFPRKFYFFWIRTCIFYSITFYLPLLTVQTSIYLCSHWSWGYI